MSFKRRILNILAAAVMMIGSVPMTFLSAHAEDQAGEAPKSLKSVKANGDGTYDITLEIEGVSSQKTDATKANVVVVFDSSGSMSEQTGQGTRLQVAKNAANSLANQLLSQNDPSDDNLKDVVEMAFIDFATNVKTNTTHTTPTTDLDTFQSWVNATSADGGTNWEAALNAANDVSFGDTDKTYVIFVSDGNPTFRDSQYDDNATDCRSYHYEYTWSGRVKVCEEDTIWGSGSNDPYPHRNFNAAKDVADDIVANTNKELYAVGAFGNAGNMANLGGTYYDATDEAALEAAFADIVDKISMGLSVADLQIEDGITAATSTEVDGTAGNFRYSVPESWGSDYAKATFEGGSVHWNPGHDKTLSNGEKASVTFTVWPSQEAMDCIAAIRNEGSCSEADLEKFGLGENADGSFRLITNSTATFKYRTATKIEGSDETSYSALSPDVQFEEERDPTNLPETDLEVMKLWADGMDPGQRDDIKEISLDLFVDRDKNPEAVEHYVFNKSGADGDAWKASYTYAVAPGVMKKLDGTEATEGLRELGPIVTVGSDEYVILEPGHDYEFDNEAYNLEDGGSNHYHITKRKYHPMIVDDGGIHDVIFSEDGTFSTAEIDENELTTLSAENTLNGGILVGKKVINNDKEDTTIEDEYEITITMNGSDTGQYRIYTYNDDGSVASRSEKKNYTGGVITEKIKVNQKIMVTDVPTGTTFEVTENLPDGYTKNEVDYLLVRYDGKDNEPGVQEVFGNTSATATVTNYLESGDLKISKEVTAENGDLSKAQSQTFDFTVNFYEKQGDAEAVRTETFTLKHGETKEFKDIPSGWYYEVIEAAKDGFNEGAETTKTGTIKKGEEAEAKFENNYKAEPVEAKIIAHKSFVEGYEQFWINSDNFEFQLIGNGEIIDSKNLTLSGSTAEFNVNITDAGTYKYKITEKTKNEDGSSAFRQGVLRQEGDEDIEVTIKVVDNGEGSLVIESQTYSKASQTIYNLYEDTKTYGAEGELEFTKVLEGRDWKDSDEFTFKITGSEGAPMPKKTEVVANKAKQTVDFGQIEFSEKDVNKTYSYTVTESYNVPSVEPADDVAGGITFTIEVSFNEETGTIDLIVSEHENTFTNIYKTTSVEAAKVWDDEEDRDGLRKNYDGYYVAVKNDEGKFVAYAELALEDKDDYAFSDLPEKNADGEVIEYEIVEASECSGAGDEITCTEFEGDDDYEVTIENGVITNKHIPEKYDETGELKVKKIWAGEGNELARPTVVVVELLANGEVIDTADIMAGQNDEWTHTFTGLYKYEDGKEIEYSVQESKIGDTSFEEGKSIIVVYDEDDRISGSWEKSISGYEVTNTWTESTDEVVYEGDDEFTLKKVDENYKPMSGVTFTIGSKDVKTNGDGEITQTVPISEDEKEESFEYEISEKETLEGYDITEGSATVTISCTSELTATDPETLVNTYTKTCTFEKSGSDKYVWDEEGLTLTVVNNRSLAKSLIIQKTVIGVSPEVLTDLEFTISGPEDFEEVTLKASEDCTINDDMISCKVDGRIPTGKYTVVENNAKIENFTLTVSGDNDVEKKVSKDERAVFEITNDYKVDTTSYTVLKLWDDAHDKDGVRPKTLTINLYGNDELVESTELSSENEYSDEELPADLDAWMYVFEELPVANEMAEVIDYSAEEVLESSDYEMIEMGGDAYMMTFVNYHELNPEDPCANGGCGGVVPPATPETGVLTRNKTSAENSSVTPNVAGMVALVSLGLMILVIKRKNQTTK